MEDSSSGGGGGHRGGHQQHDLHATMVNFRIIYMVQHMVGITIVVLMGAWVSLFLGGLGIADPKLEFNWHPVLMTIGMVYMYGNCKQHNEKRKKRSLSIQNCSFRLRTTQRSHCSVPWPSVRSQETLESLACRSARLRHGAGHRCSGRRIRFAQLRESTDTESVLAALVDRSGGGDSVRLAGQRSMRMRSASGIVVAKYRLHPPFHDRSGLAAV